MGCGTSKETAATVLNNAVTQNGSAHPPQSDANTNKGNKIKFSSSHSLFKKKYYFLFVLLVLEEQTPKNFFMQNEKKCQTWNTTRHANPHNSQQKSQFIETCLKTLLIEMCIYIIFNIYRKKQLISL